jgi:GNAT superfamily N-acetyltransferase
MRFASDADVDLLARLNHELIADEGGDNPMTIAQLGTRITEWLAGRYQAVLFETSEGEPLAYALFRDDGETLFLRQFFVVRAYRQTGVGRAAMQRLLNEVFPPEKRLLVEVLSKNARGLAFWHALGFSDYFVTLELRAVG